MDNEFNDLTTDNAATSFDNNPNNVQTSDELEASAVYTDKMGTAYSIGKAASKAAAVVGVSFSLTGGAFMLTNSFIKTPPTISETNISPISENGEYSLSYSFTIENKNSYSISFGVYEDQVEEPIFKMDVPKEEKYEGKIEKLKVNVSYRYSISYTNNTDYTGILIEDKFIFEA